MDPPAPGTVSPRSISKSWTCGRHWSLLNLRPFDLLDGIIIALVMNTSLFIERPRHIALCYGRNLKILPGRKAPDICVADEYYSRCWPEKEGEDGSDSVEKDGEKWRYYEGEIQWVVLYRRPEKVSKEHRKSRGSTMAERFLEADPTGIAAPSMWWSECWN